MDKIVFAEYLGNMDPWELNEVIQLLLQRFSQLYPEEEGIWLSLPKYDTQKRRRILERLVAMLEKEEF